ncbi:MAG: Unknown protein [uncultured Sulfurovum sp.]|uniref:Lipoprotein n=1 Tax=uncultured Sulfurovum sp. TaxID=269237 RepID=A0A6S6SHL6_9BACT|nr:MAG: Unknown protein [uncultured Sulfurovum sp.]
MVLKKTIYFLFTILVFLGCAPKPTLINSTSKVEEIDYFKERVLRKLNYVSKNDSNARVLIEFFDWKLETTSLSGLDYLNTEGYGVVFYNFESLKTNKYQNSITDNEFDKLEEMINIKFATISDLSENYLLNSYEREVLK